MVNSRLKTWTFRLTSYHSSQEKQQSALTLVTEAEGIVGTSESSPAMDIFRTLVSTFKSNVDDFKLRTEQRYKELDTLVYVHRFCEQVCVWHFWMKSFSCTCPRLHTSDWFV